MKVLQRISILILGFWSVSSTAFGQTYYSDTTLVQLSGLVLDGSTEQLIPVAYTNIFIKGQNAGTYADYQGFFSIVAKKGDVIRFTSVGYKPVDYKIPLALSSDRYSVVQLMTRDTINLPETVIFPWPSREHFTTEFLAMDISHILQEKAKLNLAKESLEKLKFEVKRDGGEYAHLYFNQQNVKYYSMGQKPPTNIFNPLAWAQFFKEWKEGKYKKKKPPVSDDDGN